MAQDEQNREEVLSYYNINGGPMQYWGRLAAFWGAMWEMLSGWAFFVIPDLGPILVAGPLGGWIIAALDNRTIFAGLSAVSASMYSIGVPWDRILAHEAALRAGKVLVVAHGTAQEVKQARAILWRWLEWGRCVESADEAVDQHTENDQSGDDAMTEVRSP